MIIYKDLGSYSRYVVREVCSFRLNGTTPDKIRDGNSRLVKSVTRVSAGLYSVVLDAQRPVPLSASSVAKHICVNVSLAQSATPTNRCNAWYVKDSYTLSGAGSSRVATLQVQVQLYNAATASDADVGDRVSIELIASINSTGYDANS
jgi:hypothetical protein